MIHKKQIRILAIDAILDLISDNRDFIEEYLTDEVDEIADREPTERESKWFEEEIEYWNDKMMDRRGTSGT